VLIANLNPGGPNGGSATQYFVGQFDGNKFTPQDAKIRWVDYGPDEYAGITWSNTGNRRIFLGWMSNWQYANQVPTVKWRNAMTIPRELKLKIVNGDILLASEPVREIDKIASKPYKVNLGGSTHLPKQFMLKMRVTHAKNYSLEFINKTGEKLIVGYDKITNRYFIDRSKSGKTDFNPAFAKMAYGLRLTNENASDLQLVVDASSIELFADNGLTVMTATFFPSSPFNRLRIESNGALPVFQGAKIWPLLSTWR